MSEYIERGALLKGLKEDHDNLMQDPEISSTKKWHEAILYDRVRRIVENAPTADVVEVKRGKWKLHKNGSGTCDQCRFTQYDVWDFDTWQNFCGHCGADMRNGGKDNG